MGGLGIAAVALAFGGGLYMGGKGIQAAANGEANAATSSTGLAKVVVVGGALFLLYRVAQKGGWA